MSRDEYITPRTTLWRSRDHQPSLLEAPDTAMEEHSTPHLHEDPASPRNPHC